MARTDFRLPAEWERQSATLLAWPHEKTDWQGDLAAIREEYVALVHAITRRQPAVVLVPPGDTSASSAIGSRPGLHLVESPYNDTWCRDYGPITLVHGGDRLALDFYFNGWGGKYAANLDNRVNTLLARHELFNRFTFRQYLFELEGGAIDSDGKGFLLVNWNSLRARHAHLSARELDHELHTLLNVDKVLGVDIPPMAGDDTDGHIDTIARFIDTDFIAYQRQPDESRHGRLLEQLQTLRQADVKGKRLPYRLVELPVPDGVDPTLPANYANFLFVNGACLVPAYGVPADREARDVLAEALSGRGIEVESVASAVMIEQYGGPHCASMHLPAALT